VGGLGPGPPLNPALIVATFHVICSICAWEPANICQTFATLTLK